MARDSEQEARHEVLREGNGGWVRYQSDVLATPVFVRLEDRDGRLVLVDLFVPSQGGGIDTTLLRSIPTGRIEAWCNHPDVAAGIRAGLKAPGPDLRRAVSYFDTTFNMNHPRRTNHWVARMMYAQVAGSDEPQAKMGELEPRMPDPLRADPHLPVPAGRNYGDDFYRLVAQRYAALATMTKSPVADIAKANNVPLSTVQRWIRETRRRGFLPPAQAGKRG